MRRYRVRVIHVNEGWRWFIWDNQAHDFAGRQDGYVSEAIARSVMHRLEAR